MKHKIHFMVMIMSIILMPLYAEVLSIKKDVQSNELKEKQDTLAEINVSKLPHIATNYYGNISGDELKGIINSMYKEFKGLKYKKLKEALNTIGELYKYLNENNLDLSEEDFGNLLYEYLDGSLTIEKLEEDFNVPKELLPHISGELLLGQEIKSAELKEKTKQLKEEAKIKRITAEIKEEKRKQEEIEEWLKGIKKGKKDLDSIIEKFNN